MAGIVTENPTRVSNMNRLEIDWTSDNLGAVSSTLITVPIGGQIEQVLLVHTGDDVPSNEYDISLTDEDGFDVLAGGGVDVAIAANVRLVPVVGTYFKVVVSGHLTLVVSGAGDTKSGKIVIFWKHEAQIQ